jgi:uncharacterized protein (DUF2147 family)
MKLTTLVAVISLAATSALADPVAGTWQTQPDDGNYAHRQMVPCGDKMCGVIARSFNASGAFTSPSIGKMTLRGDSLDLSACIAVGVLCSKQMWTRLN